MRWLKFNSLPALEVLKTVIFSSFYLLLGFHFVICYSVLMFFLAVGIKLVPLTRSFDHSAILVRIRGTIMRAI